MSERFSQRPQAGSTAGPAPALPPHTASPHHPPIMRLMANRMALSVPISAMVDLNCGGGQCSGAGSEHRTPPPGCPAAWACSRGASSSGDTPTCGRARAGRGSTHAPTPAGRAGGGGGGGASALRTHLVVLRLFYLSFELVGFLRTQPGQHRRVSRTTWLPGVRRQPGSGPCPGLALAPRCCDSSAAASPPPPPPPPPPPTRSTLSSISTLLSRKCWRSSRMRLRASQAGACV